MKYIFLIVILFNFCLNADPNIKIQGKWFNDVYGNSIITITNNTFHLKTKGIYGFETYGKIVHYDNENKYFILLTEYHSEKWGQYQVGKYGRHAWLFNNKEKTELRYSGSLLFFNSIQEAISDNGNESSADPINGKYDVYSKLNKIDNNKI